MMATGDGRMISSRKYGEAYLISAKSQGKGLQAGGCGDVSPGSKPDEGCIFFSFLDLKKREVWRVFREIDFVLLRLTCAVLHVSFCSYTISIKTETV